MAVAGANDGVCSGNEGEAMNDKLEQAKQIMAKALAEVAALGFEIFDESDAAMYAEALAFYPLTPPTSPPPSPRE
jgi:hypothetical protein